MSFVTTRITLPQAAQHNRTCWCLGGNMAEAVLARRSEFWATLVAAWPVWAGGYPNPELVVRDLNDNRDALVSRMVSAAGQIGVSPAGNIEVDVEHIDVHGYTPIDGLRVGQDDGPANSVSLGVRVEASNDEVWFSDTDAPAIVRRLAAVTREFLIRDKGGANLYDVTARWGWAKTPEFEISESRGPGTTIAPLDHDATPWPQFFLTRVIGSEDLPDVEILTLSAFPSADAPLNLDELRRLIMAREDFETVVWSGIDYGGSEACLAALHQVIIDAEIREELPWQPERTRAYAEQVFSAQPVPVMNSQLSGSTLGQMLTAAGGGAAFMAAFPHPDVGHITLYFVLIGGTRIVLGAADGISIALRQGLSHILLKWMGVPATAATSRKRKSSAPGAGTA